MAPSTPSRNPFTPSRGVGTPSRGVDTPSRGVSTPSRGVDTPSRGVDTPSRGVDTPSRGVDTPSRGFGTPRGLDTPSRSRLPPIPPPPPFDSPLLFRVIENHDPAIQGSQVCESREDLTIAQLEPLMVRHVKEWGKGGTPFRSATLALLWALWEAWRRVTALNMRPHKVEILVIDRRGLQDAMIHVLSEKRVGNVQDFRDDPQATAFAVHAREVLVEGGIPEKDIIARVSWSEIRDHLPGFFGLDAKLEKGYRYRFADCTKRSREEGRETTRAEIENFIKEVFRPDLLRRVEDDILVDGYVYNMEKHLFSHLFMGDSDDLLAQLGGLSLAR